MKKEQLDTQITKERFEQDTHTDTPRLENPDRQMTAEEYLRFEQDNLRRIIDMINSDEAYSCTRVDPKTGDTHLLVYDRKGTIISDENISLTERAGKEQKELREKTH